MCDIKWATTFIFSAFLFHILFSFFFNIEPLLFVPSTGDGNFCTEKRVGAVSLLRRLVRLENDVPSVREGPVYFFSPSFEISNASSFQNRNFIVLPVTFHIVDVGRTHLVHYRPSYEIENINLYYI